MDPNEESQLREHRCGVTGTFEDKPLDTLSIPYVGKLQLLPWKIKKAATLKFKFCTARLIKVFFFFLKKWKHIFPHQLNNKKEFLKIICWSF